MVHIQPHTARAGWNVGKARSICSVYEYSVVPIHPKCAHAANIGGKQVDITVKVDICFAEAATIFTRQLRLLADIGELAVFVFIQMPAEDGLEQNIHPTVS